MKNKIIAITLMIMMIMTGINIFPVKTTLAKEANIKNKPKIEKIKLKNRTLDYTKIAKVKNPPLKPLSQKERQKVVNAAMRVIRHKPHINYGEHWAPGGLHNSWKSLVCTTYVQKVFQLSGVPQLQKFTQNNPRYYRVSEFWNELLTENKKFKRKTPMIYFNKGSESTKSMLKKGNAGDLFIICKRDNHGRPVEHIGFCDGKGGVYHCTWGNYKIGKKYKNQDGVYHHSGSEFASGNNTSKNGAIKGIVRLSLGTLTFHKKFIKPENLPPKLKEKYLKKETYKFNIRCKGVINYNFSIKGNEKIKIINLPINKTYKITEILSENQKKHFIQPNPFIKNVNGKIQEISFIVGQKPQFKKIIIQKSVAENVNLPLDIFTFKLYEVTPKGDIYWATQKTDIQGKCEFNKLPIDRTYRVVEELTDEIKDRVDINSLVNVKIKLEANKNSKPIVYEAMNYAKAEYGKLKLIKHGSNLVSIKDEEVNGIKLKKQVINESGFAGAVFEVRANEDITCNDVIGTDFEAQYNPDKKRTNDIAIPKGTLLKTITTDSLGVVNDETKYPAKKDVGYEYTVKEIKTKPNYEINPNEAKIRIRRISELQEEFFKKHFIKPKTHAISTHKDIDYSKLYGKEDRSVYYDSEQDGINDGIESPSGEYKQHKADKAINSRHGTANRSDLMGYTGKGDKEPDSYEYIKHESKKTKYVHLKDPNTGKTEKTEEDLEEFKKSQVRFTNSSILGSNKFKKLAIDINKEMEKNGSLSSPIDNVIFGVVADENIKAQDGKTIHKGDIVSILDKQKIDNYKAHFTNKELLIPAKYIIKELKTDKGYILPKDKINAQYEQNNTKKIINKVNPNVPQTGKKLSDYTWIILAICVFALGIIRLVTIAKKNRKTNKTN